MNPIISQKSQMSGIEQNYLQKVPTLRINVNVNDSWSVLVLVVSWILFVLSACSLKSHADGVTFTSSAFYWLLRNLVEKSLFYQIE